MADEDRQVHVHEVVVPEHGSRVQESAYDASLVVDTTPTMYVFSVSDRGVVSGLG
jgi:hypothetical protein